MLKIESITITQIYFLTPLEKIPAIEPENQKTRKQECVYNVYCDWADHNLDMRSNQKAS